MKEKKKKKKSLVGMGETLCLFFFFFAPGGGRKRIRRKINILFDTNPGPARPRARGGEGAFIASCSPRGLAACKLNVAG